MKKKLLNVYLKNKKIIDKIAFEKLNSIKEKTFDSSCSIQCYTLKLLEQIFQAFHKKSRDFPCLSRYFISNKTLTK